MGLSCSGLWRAGAKRQTSPWIGRQPITGHIDRQPFTLAFTWSEWDLNAQSGTPIMWEGNWDSGFLSPRPSSEFVFWVEPDRYVIFEGSNKPSEKRKKKCDVKSVFPLGFPSIARHCGLHPVAVVLWLHHPDGSVLLAANGHNRLLRRLHVHQEDLRSS